MTTAGQVRYAFPAFRVYIFGVDITEDVLDLDIRYQIGRSPNIAKVTLANNLDKYILTTSDLMKLFGPEVQKQIIDHINRMATHQKLATMLGVSYSIDLELLDKFSDDIIRQQARELVPEIKRNVVLNKITQRIEGVEAPDIAGKTGGIHVRQLTGDAFRYPFQAEDPIFHANDPIRIFLRDPFEPKRWYHAFCGFLSDFDDHVDENNQRILTITAEGPSKILRYARITTNPGIVDIAAIQNSELDATQRSFYEAGFRGLTLPEVLFAIIFGNDPQQEFEGKFAVEAKDANGNKLPRQIRFKGIGSFNFKRSTTVEFGPSTSGGSFDPLTASVVPNFSVSTLAEYQSIIDHEVKISDLDDMLLEDADTTEVNQFKSNIPRNSNNEPDISEIMDFIGTNPTLYPVDGGALIILTPKSFQAETNREVLLKDIIGTVSMITEFKSRLTMIYDIIERIEFLFYESPKGDLICEFPLYDFNPEDFDPIPGAGPATVPDISIKYISPESRLPDEKSEISRGPFSSRWIVTKADTYNFSKGITDEKVRTQIASDWYPAQNYDNNVGSTRGILKPAVVTLKHLVPLYWLRLEQANPKGIISSGHAALAFAHIVLNKMNADARNIGINAVPNLGMWLNRPVFFEPRNCYGVLTNINHSIKWGMGGSMDTRLGINYIRGWDGLLSEPDAQGNRVPIYSTIGGQPSRPLDYKLLFGLKSNIGGSVVLAGEPDGPSTLA